jgi:hypothetical protein
MEINEKKAYMTPIISKISIRKSTLGNSGENADDSSFTAS